MVEPFLLPVEEIRPASPLPAGLNVLTLCAIAATLRNTHQRIQPLVVEKRDGDWHLVDGRHRWHAHWIAGRPEAWCVEHGTEGGSHGG